jgi:hypothetical protein
MRAARPHTCSPKRLRDPRSPHLWHLTANVRGYGGAQQKKCNAKSDDEWDLSHGTAPPCVCALSRFDDYI